MDVDGERRLTEPAISLNAIEISGTQYDSPFTCFGVCDMYSVANLEADPSKRAQK